MSSTRDRFYELAAYLGTLMDSDPTEAVRQTREIDLDTPERINLMGLHAAILVDGGALNRQRDAIEEGLALFRELYGLFSIAGTTYSIANELVAAAGNPSYDPRWLDCAIALI